MFRTIIAVFSVMAGIISGVMTIVIIALAKAYHAEDTIYLAWYCVAIFILSFLAFKWADGSMAKWHRSWIASRSW